MDGVTRPGSLFLSSKEVALVAGWRSRCSRSWKCRRFLKEHPGAEILAQTANDATEHTGYWPRRRRQPTSHYTNTSTAAFSTDSLSILLPLYAGATARTWAKGR